MSESTTRFAARDLHGVWVALFTPLRRDDPRNIRNSIDYEKAAEMIEVLLAEGITGIVPVGTTGQSPTVSPRQHVDFIRFVHERIAGRARMIAGAGSNCTRESIDTIGEIRKVAPEVPFLCVTGYYNNPPQEGIVAHFKAIAEETGASIVLYNVPSRTSSYLQPETVVELAAHPQIIGVKQAVDFVNPGRFQDDTRRIIEETRNLDFAILSGEDDALAALLRLGGHGIISATANIPEAARIYLAMAKAHAEGRDGDLQTLQGQVTPFVRWAFCRKNPIPLAAVFDSPVFLPLVSLVDTARGREDWAEMKAFLGANAPGVKRWLGE